MNDKSTAAQIGQVLKQNNLLRSRLEGVRQKLVDHAANITREADIISKALRIEYTGHVVLLQQDGDGWKCLGVVDSRDLPDDVPEDFDLALPIPVPSSLDEFEGW